MQNALINVCELNAYIFLDVSGVRAQFWEIWRLVLITKWRDFACSSNLRRHSQKEMLCNYSSPHLVSRQLKLFNIFIFGMTYLNLRSEGALFSSRLLCAHVWLKSTKSATPDEFYRYTGEPCHLTQHWKLISHIQMISLRKWKKLTANHLSLMSSFAGPSYYTIRSSVCIVLSWDPYICSLCNLC